MVPYEMCGRFSPRSHETKAHKTSVSEGSAGSKVPLSDEFIVVECLCY